MVQLQLSATVAIRCQFGSAARGGAVARRGMIAAARLIRIMAHSVAPSLPPCQSKSAFDRRYGGLAIMVVTAARTRPQQFLVMWIQPHEPFISVPSQLHR